MARKESAGLGDDQGLREELEALKAKIVSAASAGTLPKGQDPFGLAGTESGEVSAALEAAEQMFLTEGLSRAMTPRVANWFFVNREDTHALLIIGGVGAAMNGETPMPVAQVTEVFRVEHTFLRKLATVINEVLADATEH